MSDIPISSSIEGIYEIAGAAEVAKHRLLMRPLFDSGLLLSAQWLISQGWFAVPVDSFAGSNEVPELKLINAARKIGVTRAIAFPVDGFESENHGQSTYQVDMTLLALEAFELRRVALTYILAPEPPVFAVVFGEDIHIVAGRLDFVVDALGRSPADAFADFETFCRSFEMLNDHAKQYVCALRRHYASFSLGKSKGSGKI